MYRLTSLVSKKNKNIRRSDACILQSSPYLRSIVRTPIFYQSPTGNFRQVLGHGIARYGFFGFLNSDRATSDMGPYVQSNLPPQMQALSVQYLAKKKSKTKRGLKKQLFSRLLQLFPSALGTLESGTKLVMSPVVSTSDVISGHFPGKDELAQDSSWGTSTVKTDSLQGDLLVSGNIITCSDNAETDLCTLELPYWDNLASLIWL
jgi:hypothetical protein